MAVRIARRFVRLRPGDPGGWRLLCRALEKSSRYADLEDAAKRGLIRHPGDARLRYSLGLALEGRTREGEDRSSEAEQTYESLMHDDPTSPLPYLGLAKMALHREDLNRAAALAQQADELGASSDGTMIMSLIGVALSVPSLRSRGRDLVQRAADLVPEEWLPQLMAGVILEAVDPDGSERDIKRARAMWKGSPARLEDDLPYLRRQLNEHPRDKPRSGSGR